eukprot:XP_001694561.1 hydroxyproline-rich glycoprotein [Chlamydomonas reinhardtii]
MPAAAPEGPPAPLSAPAPGGVDIAAAQAAAAAIFSKYHPGAQAKGATPGSAPAVAAAAGTAGAGALELAREVVINDAPTGVRIHLTKRGVQDEIQSRTATIIVTRGRYYPPGVQPDGKEKPLHLLVRPGAHAGTTDAEKHQAVSNAVSDIQRILQGMPPTARPPAGSPQPPAATAAAYGAPQAAPAPPGGFPLADKIKGPGNTYVQHIATTTGATVQLRGRGSIDAEGPDPMHVFISAAAPKALEDAKSLVLDLLRTVGDEFKRSYPAAAHTVLAPVVTAPPGAPQPTPAYAPPVPAPYYPPPGAPAYGYHHPPPGAPPPQYYPPPGSYAPPYGYAPPGAPPGAAGAPPPYGYALAGAPPPYAYAPPGAAPAPYGAPPPRPYAPAGAYPGSAPPGAYAPSGAGPGPAGAYQPPGTVAPAYASQPVQGSAAGAPAPAHGGAYGSSAAATGPAAAGAAAGGNSTVANNASGSGNGGPPKRKFREAREGEQARPSPPPPDNPYAAYAAQYGRGQQPQQQQQQGQQQGQQDAGVDAKAAAPAPLDRNGGVAQEVPAATGPAGDGDSGGGAGGAITGSLHGLLHGYGDDD